MAGQQVAVRAVGNGGVESLSSHINDAEMSWALLRCPSDQGACRDKLVSITCSGADMADTERKELLPLSSRVLKLFGTSDISLSITQCQELSEQLAAALAETGKCNVSTEQSPPVFEDAVKWESKAEQALSAVGKEVSPYNWVLLEPAKLELHGAGCGGLDELKEQLLADKVLFGVLRFTFPRAEPAPPIIKYLFVHWIGSKVSAVRRGQWNSKLEEAVLKIRKFCDFAFRKTAYTLEDLELRCLIEELGRVTCVTSSDTRQFSEEWYLESLRQGPQLPLQIDSMPLADEICDSKLQCLSDPLLRESAKRAIQIVREQGREWTWVLLAPAECKDFSSGGA